MTAEKNIGQTISGEVNLSDYSGETIEILFAGDFYPANRALDLILKENYQNLFNDFLPVLKAKDLSVVNLESPLTSAKHAISKIGPNLKAHPNCIKALNFAGFDVAALANNHIFDFGEEGLRDTLNVCKSAGIKTVGAGLTRLEKESPLYVNIKSTKIAFVNITENEFSTLDTVNSGANGLDPVNNYFQIREAKKNADLVFVIAHGGNELYPLPSPRLVSLYRFFVEIGANAVIGHHPHCASGYELWNGIPIFYSIGNFIFDIPEKMDEIWYTGYTVKLSAAGGKIVKINLNPYVQFKEKPGVNKLEGEDKKNFLIKIAEYSDIIGDASRLKSSWVEFCQNRKMDYLSNLLRMGRFKSRLLRSGITILKMINEKEILRIMNMIRCEAHREALLEILEKLTSERK